MFAINHASAALIFKKQLKDQVSMFWILLAVQLVELMWVVFNLVGLETTTTDKEVHYLGNIHLSHMPFSHSLLSSVVIAVTGGVIFYLWKRSWKTGFWMGVAFFSHFVLDVVTHAKDLPLGIGGHTFIGIGLYSNLPVIGFILELGFGLACWWYYKGSQTLLWIIILFNLANVTMFVPQLGGPEVFMANQPRLIAIVILTQIVITLILVGVYAKRQKKEESKSYLVNAVS